LCRHSLRTRPFRLVNSFQKHVHTALREPACVILTA